jgi:hypothetical protein
MSSDVATSADDASATTGPGDLSEASRRLLEQSFDEGHLKLIGQVVASEPVNRDPSTPAQMPALQGPAPARAALDPTGWLNSER